MFCGNEIFWAFEKPIINSSKSEKTLENTCKGVYFLVKLQASACNLIEKRNSITCIFWLVCLHFQSTFLKDDLKEKNLQFWNLLHIRLLRVYCSSFLAVADCMFDRWSTFNIDKSKPFEKSVSSEINNKKVKRGKYSVKVDCRRYCTWKNVGNMEM